MNSPYNMLPSDAKCDCPNCGSTIKRKEIVTKGLGEIYCEECA